MTDFNSDYNKSIVMYLAKYTVVSDAVSPLTNVVGSQWLTLEPWVIAPLNMFL
jgi:hypothetical protein